MNGLYKPGPSSAVKRTRGRRMPLPGANEPTKKAPRTAADRSKTLRQSTAAASSPPDPTRKPWGSHRAYKRPRLNAAFRTTCTCRRGSPPPARRRGMGQRDRCRNKRKAVAARRCTWDPSPDTRVPWSRRPGLGRRSHSRTQARRHGNGVGDRRFDSRSRRRRSKST